MSIDVNVQNDLVIVTESSEDITVNVSNAAGPAGQGVPVGGTTGQVLKKFSNTNYDTFWAADASGLTSVGLSMPSAFTVSNSPLTSNGTLTVTGAGNATQYVRGDGQLATLPTGSSGGGASVSYYLNGSVNQGTIGGVTYYEINRTPILGAGTDFTRNTNGYIASFLTDANDPALLSIPAGNFNFETYFQASSGGGNPTFYVELYKYDGTTFTLIASNSGSPKLINDGTNIEAYFSALAVPQTTLTLTDRLAVRIYVNTSGRTITLHTENNTLCQVITTFTTGLNALNGLTSQVQYFATGTSGTDFAISSASSTHTFNLPTASATNRGALSSADWTSFNNKQATLTLTTTGTSGAATLVGATLNIPQYSGGGGTTIYTGDGTLAGDRTVTSNGNSLRILGGKEFNTNIQTSLILEGTTTSKYVELYLKNVNASGKTYSFRSDPDGKYTFLNMTDVVNLYQYNPSNTQHTFSGSQVNVVGSSINSQGLWLGTTSGTLSNYNLYSNSGITFVNATADIRFAISNSEKIRLTSAGRLLLGTTDEGTFRLDVNGTARVSGKSFFGNGSSYIYSSFQSVVNTSSTSSAYFEVSGAASNTSAILFTKAGSLSTMWNLGTDASNDFYLFRHGINKDLFKVFDSSTNVGINSSSDVASAQLHITSTTKGFLPPRMTTTQRDAIASPATGLQIYNTTTNANNFYDGTAWVAAGGGGGTTIYTGDGTLTGNRTVSLSLIHI